MPPSTRCNIIYRFNPRSRTGSDQCRRQRAAILYIVSIHAPARGATFHMLFDVVNGQFQSTLPHGERQIVRLLLHAQPLVSIHAPARGATTRTPFGILYSSGFNPRSRTGSDETSIYFLFLQVVSIHAPARGATRFPGIKSDQYRFQSTLPHGERHSTRLFFHRTRCFNPRSRTGSDSICSGSRPSRYCFNPRSRTGSDKLSLEEGMYGQAFQSTLPHGERPAGDENALGDFWVSIHAPARGATHIIHTPFFRFRFQSTLPHGERRFR